MADPLVSAGYFLTRPVRVEWLPGAPEVLTLAEHLAPTLPSGCFLEGSQGPWPNHREEQRQKVLAFFSIREGRLEEIRRETVAVFGREWDFDGACLRLEYARSVARRFLDDATDARIVGLAVAPGQARTIEARFRAGASNGYVPAWLRSPAPPEGGGTVLGFEPAPILRESPQRVCSWICEGLDWDEVEREAGVRPDARGLLASLSDAERACDWLRAQPGLCGGDDWFAWRLASYSLCTSSGTAPRP
jgi:hypothetical protein